LDIELSEVLLDIIQGGYFRLVDGTIKPVLMENADADRNERPISQPRPAQNGCGTRVDLTPNGLS
jgi:hypothetical protein